jgi:hypothetical protein
VNSNNLLILPKSLPKASVGGNEDGALEELAVLENSPVLDSQSLEQQQPFGMAKVTALEIPVEWMRWCGLCESEERFVATLEGKFGLIGCCSTCGNERIAPFTRAVSGVA